MAILIPQQGIGYIKGALSKRAGQRELMTTRVKSVNDPITGEEMGHGPVEYFPMKVRDLKKKPKKGKEAAQNAIWSQACIIALEIYRDRSHPRFMEMYALWREDCKTRSKKMRLDNFITSIIAQELGAKKEGHP